MNPAIEAAAREELDGVVLALRRSLSDAGPVLKARGVELALAAKDVGESVLAKRVTFDEGKDALGKLSRAVASEALAASYEGKAALVAALTTAANGVLRIAALALA